jgi:hypothetical protein
MIIKLVTRRLLVSLAALISLLVLGLVNKTDVAMSIASIAIAVAGSSAWEAKGRPDDKP